MLYPLKRRDIRRAASVLAEAFQDDPIWNAVCEGEADVRKRLRAIFEIAVRHGMTYGEVVAPSERLEGIVAWVPGEHVDMTPWQLVCSGGLGAAMRIGQNVAKRMGPIYRPVTEYRQEHLTGFPFLYLLVFGVPPEHRGVGFGRKLIGAVIDEAERTGLPPCVGLEARRTSPCTSILDSELSSGSPSRRSAWRTRRW